MTQNERKKRITEVIKDCGISANLSGYHYLREAIDLTLSDFEYVQRITKLLYPAVAKKYKTTPSRAERGIRHAIETGWMRADFGFLNELFGHSLPVDKCKPTNSEFIATLADYIALNED